MRIAICAVLLASTLSVARCSADCEPRITGIIDGPLPQGTPKAIELYFPCTVADASAYAVGWAVDAGHVLQTALSGCVPGGGFVYVASEHQRFAEWFGFAPNFVNESLSVDGNDAVELFSNGSAIDVFGIPQADGTRTLWEYLDGWAYRANATAPGPAFDIDSWVFSGKNALDGDSSNRNSYNPFPVAAYRSSLGAPANSSGETCPEGGDAAGIEDSKKCKPRITGVIAGPLPESAPSAIELYFPCTVTDASSYKLESGSTGGAASGRRTPLSGCISGGSFVYVAGDESAFASWFDFEPAFEGEAAIIDGDDAIQLFEGTTEIDTFGNVSGDASGQAWRYVAGWAYRKSNVEPNGGAFAPENWTFSGTDGLQGATSNQDAAAAFPVGSYSAPAVESFSGSCPSTQGGGGGTDSGGEDSEGFPILYAVVIGALAASLCLALWTVSMYAVKALRRKLPGGRGGESQQSAAPQQRGSHGTVVGRSASRGASAGGDSGPPEGRAANDRRFAGV